MSHKPKFSPANPPWQPLLLALLVATFVGGAFLAVGKRGPSQARQRTISNLKILDALMQDFLAAGNPEPRAPSPWIYGDAGKRAPEGYAETSPSSDPVQWLAALRASPAFSKRLSVFAFTDDKLVPKRKGYAAVNDVLLDEWGTPVRYVPSDPGTGKPGYFVSAGPDGAFSMTAPAPSSPKRADELLSTDPG